MTFLVYHAVAPGMIPTGRIQICDDPFLAFIFLISGIFLDHLYLYGKKKQEIKDKQAVSEGSKGMCQNGIFEYFGLIILKSIFFFH